MISSSEALKLILETTTERSGEMVEVSQLSNRVLNNDIVAKREQPPFDRIIMDGIALNSKLKNKTYKIEGVQAAGAKQLELTNNNNCIEAMTGAILPKGADCIIPYENITIESGIATIDTSDLIAGNNIHKKGSDYSSGKVLVPSGTKVNSPISAIIASQGEKLVKVYTLPKIAILSTGSELVELGKEVQEHQIYMSNTYAIEQELRNYGVTNIARVHISDDKEQTDKIIKELISNNDILIITGGVSRGKFDFIPQSLNDLGVEKIFHKVKQKPGKPMWYGIKKEKQVFALPGNPVSCLVCLRKYVLPSLDKSFNTLAPPIFGKLTQEIIFKKNFSYFVPVVAQSTKDGGFQLSPLKSNNSGDFASLALSTGFVELPEDKEIYPKDSIYQYFPWS
jgi:molybdopterin molybdotransferase